MTTFTFSQLVAENHNDPQWLQMVQSLINYKQKLVENESKKHVIFAQNKTKIRKLLLCEYKVHTINGVQFIRLSHLTAVLNQSKLLKRDFSREGFIEVNTLIKWIHEENDKIKKAWLKKYGC